MLVALFVLFLAELFVIVQVAHVVGVLNTVVLLVVVSVLGAALMRRAGLGVWRRARARIEAGEVPGRELIDGVMVLTGAALLAVPGFITDVLGLLLFLPPVRALVRAVALRRLQRRASITVVEARTRAGPTVLDARARPTPRAELPTVVDVRGGTAGRGAGAPTPPEEPAPPVGPGAPGGSETQ